MSWRTVYITKRAKLELRMGSLVIRSDETLKIHLSEIAILVVESTAVSLTASLIAELIKQKIKVIFCDDRHNPTCELVALYGSHDTSDGIRKQIAWLPDIKTKIWTHIVKEKIKMQAMLLDHYGLEQADLLWSYLNEVQSGDATNREGHAAKVYFNALFGSNFSRKRACCINSALDYGYGLILSTFNKAIVSQGRITQLGIWHDNKFNYFNFSSDLMEPFRPYIDQLVLELDLEEKEFPKTIKFSILKILEKDILLYGQKYKMINAINIYVIKILESLDDRDLSALPKLYIMEQEHV